MADRLHQWSNVSHLPGLGVESVFGRTVRGERAIGDLSRWKPIQFGETIWPAGTYSVRGRPPIYDVSTVRTYFFGVPHSGAVLVTDFDFLGGLDECILAERDAFDPTVPKALGEDGLLTAASRTLALPAGEWRLRFGQDKHQFLVLGDLSAVFSLDPGAAGLDLDAVDNAALRQLMFKDTDVQYRVDQSPISFPLDANGPVDMMVALWATNTVLAGFDAYGELGRRRLQEMVESAAQIVAAITRTREIRADALTLLEDLDLATRSDLEAASPVQPGTEVRRAQLVDTAQRLSRLELDLSFGADILRGPSLVWGGRPLERYQAALRHEMLFDDTVDLTAHLVRRLASIVDSQRAVSDVDLAREAAERQSEQLRASAELIAVTNSLLDKTEFARAAATVVSVALAVVSVGSLFGSLASIPAAGSWLSPAVRNVAIAFAIVMFAALFGYGLHRASQRTLTERGAVLARRLAVPAAVVAIGGFGGAAAIRGARAWLLSSLSTGVVFTILTLILLALAGEFLGKRAGSGPLRSGARYGSSEANADDL